MGSVGNCIIYWDMHFKVLLRSTASVGYPDPGFLSSATKASMPKNHSNG